jgi:hypothetical protein
MSPIVVVVSGSLSKYIDCAGKFKRKAMFLLSKSVEMLADGRPIT